MTRASKKAAERFFALETAKRIGANWNLGEDRESPDFLVTEGGHRFGLEVSEVFMGPSGRDGSAMKRAESVVQRTVNSLRARFEQIANASLRVQLVGSLSAKNLESVLSRLLAEDFPSKPVLHHVVFDTRNGLRAHATKGLRHDWFSVNDRVGWVDRDPIAKLAEALEAKSSDLKKLQDAVGPDVRLLFVSNRFNNSGKLCLSQPAGIDLMGFRAVYFFSFPENVIVFQGGELAA